MERLTIREVIEHCNRHTERVERHSSRMQLEETPIGNSDFMKQYWEHRQVAEWLEELQSLKDKQEQGLLISLPCKIGDSLYQKRKDGMYEYKVIGLVYDIINKEWMLEVAVQVRSKWIKTVCSMECVGTTSFLTEAEAEEALARMKGE